MLKPINAKAAVTFPQGLNLTLAWEGSSRLVFVSGVVPGGVAVTLDRLVDLMELPADRGSVIGWSVEVQSALRALDSVDAAPAALLALRKPVVAKRRTITAREG